MRAFIFLFILAVTTPALAIVVRHDAKSGDYLADEKDYPALFALYRSPQGFKDCIATLIEPRWAVTAAHCTEDQPFLDGMENGAYAVEINGGDAIIDAVFRYAPADEDEADSDLALLRLSSPVEGVAPIPLYQHSDEEGRVVIMPGWGRTGNGVTGVTGGDGKFRIAENRIDAAHQGWLIWKFDDPRSLVSHALTLEGISGPGDSGGPALILTPAGLVVAGVSSRQRTYGRPEGVYGVEEYFVRVSAYVPWMEDIMARN